MTIEETIPEPVPEPEATPEPVNAFLNQVGRGGDQKGPKYVVQTAEHLVVGEDIGFRRHVVRRRIEARLEVIGDERDEECVEARES